jgi:protein associated with RNAse G/E
VGESKTRSIVVRVNKYDGLEHRRWPAHLVEQAGPLLVLDAVFHEEIEHDILGKVAFGTLSTEYYWLDRWYNVFRFSDPDGKFQKFYCNVTMPPSFQDGVLSYVDLDIDLLVKPDFSYRVLDLEDFEQNTSRYGYSREVQEKAHAALAELIKLIEARSFPFDE